MESTGHSISINIYLLERTETSHPDAWAKVVVAAATESQARQIANAESGAEGYVWTDGNLVQAKLLGVAGLDVHGVILSAKE